MLYFVDIVLLLILPTLTFVAYKFEGMQGCNFVLAGYVFLCIWRAGVAMVALFIIFIIMYVCVSPHSARALYIVFKRVYCLKSNFLPLRSPVFSFLLSNIFLNHVYWNRISLERMISLHFIQSEL